MKKKKTKKETSDLIMSYYKKLSQDIPTSDTKGRGQVKGNHIDRINNLLNNSEK